jgi:hypothetical protein
MKAGVVADGGSLRNRSRSQVLRVGLGTERHVGAPETSDLRVRGQRFERLPHLEHYATRASLSSYHADRIRCITNDCMTPARLTRDYGMYYMKDL